MSGLRDPQRHRPEIEIADRNRLLSQDSATLENTLIHGENLTALELLQQQFAGQIQCVYIDPPYNTGSRFAHYRDDIDHSTWLSGMRIRFELLKSLLRPSGFLCCQIDDSQSHYLKVLLDEVFGRENYLATFYIRVRYPSKTLKQDMNFHKEIEQIHLYRRTASARPNLPKKTINFEKFVYEVEEINPGRELVLGGKQVQIFPSGTYRILKGEASPHKLKEIWASGTILDGNSSGRFFRDHLTGRAATDGIGTLYKVFGIGNDSYSYRYFTGPARSGATKGKYYQGVPQSHLATSPATTSTPIQTFYDLAASFGNCRHEGGVSFRSGKKPEALLETILTHFSEPHDWVLDCFAGSGTTGAVAHKMRRRWILVESGDHCRTHIVPRLQSVVDGTDVTGVTKSTGWQGGGNFRYYEF